MDRTRQKPDDIAGPDLTRFAVDRDLPPSVNDSPDFGAHIMIMEPDLTAGIDKDLSAPGGRRRSQ